MVTQASNPSALKGEVGRSPQFQDQSVLQSEILSQKIGGKNTQKEKKKTCQ